MPVPVMGPILFPAHSANQNPLSQTAVIFDGLTVGRGDREFCRDGLAQGDEARASERGHGDGRRDRVILERLDTEAEAWPAACRRRACTPAAARRKGFVTP